METYEGVTNRVYPNIIEAVIVEGTQVIIERPEAIDAKTYELHPLFYSITNPHEHLVTSFGRPVNVAFALAEVLWILGGRDDVAMLKAYNSTIHQFSDDGQRFNAAYGYRLRHTFGHDQIEDVVRTLRDDPSSRQATLVISNPVDDKGWDRVIADDSANLVYSKHQTKDRACNVLAHLMIRDGKLDWLQVVRSNDAVWGVPYNIMQWTHLHEYIAGLVGVPMGRYMCMVDSMHIYEQHFQAAHDIEYFDLYRHRKQHDYMRVGVDVINTALREERLLREAKHPWNPPPDVYEIIGDYWFEVLKVLYAHRLYTEHEDEQCAWWLKRCDPVYGAAQARFYYHHRWHKPDHQHYLDMVLQEDDAVRSWATAYDPEDPE